MPQLNISQETYNAIAEAAKQRRQTPEQLLDQIAHLLDRELTPIMEEDEFAEYILGIPKDQLAPQSQP